MNLTELTFVVAFTVCLSRCKVLVTLPTGNYLGEVVTTQTGVEYYSFKGIKYATAKRFQEAVLLAKSNETYDAREFGPICYQDFSQLEPYVDIHPHMSEDCLYLNVYSPNLTDSLPVILFIHGGTFSMGATNLYKPDMFMDSELIIMVTVAYRLNAFGFLYMDDPRYPANLGLRDQILALRWVNKYIKEFGGDGSRVTLYGHSSGSSSVDIIMHSPLAKGLFVGAIGESGVSSSRWALQPRCTGLQRRDELADKIGCRQHIPRSKGNAYQLYKCLENKHPAEFINALKNFKVVYTLTPFPPIVELMSVPNPVITYYPWLNATNSSDLVPRITGINSNEGVSIIDGISKVFELPFVGATAELFGQYFLPDVFLYYYLAKSPKEATDKLLSHYYTEVIYDTKQVAIQVVSQGFFDYPLVRSLRTVRSPTYVYYFNFTDPDQSDGVGHNGELPYLWIYPIGHTNMTENRGEKKMSNLMFDSLINFAYHQTPLNSVVVWERYDYRRDRILVTDNDGIQMKKNPSRKENEFWESLEIDTSPKVSHC